MEINRNIPELDYVPLTNDLLFHMVFSKNEIALRNLLSSLLDIPENDIIQITVLNPVQYADAFDTKITVLDLKLHLNGERYIIIEIAARGAVSALRIRFPRETSEPPLFNTICDSDSSKPPSLPINREIVFLSFFVFIGKTQI